MDMDINNVAKALNKRGFQTVVVEDRSKVFSEIDKLIKGGESVGFGGSITMKEIGVQKYLQDKGCTIYGFGFYDGDDMYQKAFMSDWYFSSANAITEDGEIVNIDGRSNRISAIAGGPRQVVIIAGENKIVGGLDDAISRIRNVVAPKNAERLDRNTPCRKTGKCYYCYNKDTMCNNTLIQHHPSTGKDVYVILVKESLGY